MNKLSQTLEHISQTFLRKSADRASECFPKRQLRNLCGLASSVRPKARRFQKTGWSAAVCTIVSLMLGNASTQAFDETPPPVPAQVSPSSEGRTSISDVQPYPYSYSQQPMYSIGAPEPDYFAMNGGSSEPMFRERGLGYYFRAGHQGGKGIGTEESLTYLEAMPYAFWEETMFLADGRVWALNSGRMGGSIGAGLRRYFPQIDRTIGMMAWYDIDATHLEDFQEMVVTLESHGNRLDWDANIYMPFDVRKQDIGLDFNDGSQRFVGNNILFDQTRTSAFALTGFDTMWSTPIGLEFAQPLDMRIGAGFYHFVHGDINDIWGWKGELEANVLRYLDLSLAVSDDATFDTRVTVNASWTFDPNREVGERDRTWDRMVLPPSRLWTVPKAEVAVVEPDQVAINPTTGMPYFVVHVDSITGVNAPGAGTVEMPFNTIENAINGVNMVPIDTYDTVFVHAGSVFDGQPTIVVPEGKRFLGEGDRIGHLFSYNQFGELRGPRARNDYNDAIFDARPLFTNLGTPAGPGVTFDLVGALGGTVISNDVTEFSGFVLGNPDGTDPTSGDSLVTFDPTTTVAPGQGPSGNGIEYVTLGTTATATRFVDIHGAENNGLHFVGTSGTFELQSVIINQSGNHEMFVSGGDPTINYRSTSAADRSTLTDGQFTNRLESVVVNRDNLSGLAPAQFAGFPGTTTGAPGDNHDLLVQATTGGAVNWIDVITNDQGGDGFLITLASQSNVTIPVSTTIINSRGNGIAVMPGSSGAITISSTRTDLQTFGGMFITNPAANAIQIGLPVDPVLATPPGIETAATVSFVQPITINQLDQQNSGVMIANTSGNTVFQGTSLMTIDYNNPATSAGTAAGFEFFQNFSGNLTLNNALTINNSGGPGFRISNDLDAGFPDGGPGNVFYFTPPNAGFLTINNAAVNQGVGGAALLIGADSPAGNPSNSVAGSGYEGDIRFAAPININNSNGAGIQANFNTGDITFGNGVIVNANQAVVASQVGLFDNSGDILFTTLTINNVRGGDVDFLDDNEPTPAELAAITASLDMRRNTGDLVFNDLTVFSNGNAVLPSATGVFGYNNRVITIQDAEIDVFGATAVEIFTANSAVPLAPPFGLTDLSLELVDVNSTLAPDHGIHLANLKGQAIIDGGDISLGGSSLGDEFPGQDYEAGIYVDNSLLRTRELANFGVIFGQSRSFSLDITEAQGGLDLDLNTKGILGIAFDDLTIDGASFRLNDREALDLIDVVNVEITGTTFVDNQNFNIGVGGPTVEFATLRSVYTLTLNEDNRATVANGNDGNPLFYDLVVGTRTPDFDVATPVEANQFNEFFAQYSILVQNNAPDNQIGVLDTGFEGPEAGLIVNNNDFVHDGNSLLAPDFQGFVFFRDVGANSEVNFNVVMNSFDEQGDNFQGFNPDATDFGAIGFSHNSEASSTEDNIVLNAVDNNINLEEENSIGFYIQDTGDGTMTVLIDDTDDDALTEGLDPLNDLLVADIFVSEGPVFYFDVETDATISITNLEIEVGEEEDGGAVATTIDDQRVFFFENAAGPTDITISNNFIVINDLGSAGINGFLTLVNDILVTEFDAASGDISLNSPQTNTVIVVPPGLPLTNPALLFDGPATGNFTGQLDFNGVFVP